LTADRQGRPYRPRGAACRNQPGGRTAYGCYPLPPLCRSDTRISAVASSIRRSCAAARTTSWRVSLSPFFIADKAIQIGKLMVWTPVPMIR
jgi:hypothetical protein